MGEGLKKVAKQCGGLTATDGKTKVTYDENGKVKKIKKKEVKNG